MQSKWIEKDTMQKIAIMKSAVAILISHKVHSITKKSTRDKEENFIRPLLQLDMYMN